MLHLIQSTWGKDLSEAFTSCHGCNLSHENLSVCSGCYNASFCNTICQENHVCIGTDISVLSKDIFGELSKWLNVKDLGNLRLVSREFNRKLREQFFQRTEIDLTSFYNSEDKRLKSIIPIMPLIKRVKLFSLISLSILKANGAKLTHITFSNGFNNDLTFNIPETIKGTSLEASWDTRYLPETLTHLTFGSKFNREVMNILPENLTHLTFGDDFNQEVKNGLPKNLTHLTFGFFFNRDVKDGLPENLTHLTFGFQFRKDVRGGLPKKLTYLKVGSAYPFKNGLPEFTFF